MRFIRTSVALTLASFVTGSLGYLVLSTVMEDVFGTVYRMFTYHQQHPFQYIGVVAAIFGFWGALWFRWFGETRGWRRWTSMLATILLVLVLSSVPGGMLWKIHDMQAGFFTEGERFWRDILGGASKGLRLGGWILLISFPYNILGLGVGILLLHRVPQAVAGTGRPADAVEDPL